MEPIAAVDKPNGHQSNPPFSDEQLKLALDHDKAGKDAQNRSKETPVINSEEQLAQAAETAKKQQAWLDEQAAKQKAAATPAQDQIAAIKDKLVESGPAVVPEGPKPVELTMDQARTHMRKRSRFLASKLQQQYVEIANATFDEAMHTIAELKGDPKVQDKIKKVAIKSIHEAGEFLRYAIDAKTLADVLISD